MLRNPQMGELVISDELRLSMPGVDVPAVIDENWLRENGKCKGADPELFYGPEIPGNNIKELPTAKKNRLNEARRICGGCAVKTACLEYALANSQDKYDVGRIGIWAGTTPRQRTYIANRRAAIERSRMAHPSRAQMLGGESSNL